MTRLKRYRDRKPGERVTKPDKDRWIQRATLIVHPEQLQGFTDRAVARAAIEALVKKHKCSFEEQRDARSRSGRFKRSHVDV